MAFPRYLALGALAALLAPARAAFSDEVLAGAPVDISVTVYRNPYRAEGAMQLNRLNGFALISETRMLKLPAGSSRVRFEGVADGIVSASAIVTGLKGVVIEKNRDANLLSPGSLLQASLGKPLQLLRTNRKKGTTERVSGTLLSSADGVVFEGPNGVEALRCSGMPETFSFEPPSGLSAHPTLSVAVKAAAAVSIPVTLSYLAEGFDWAANYTAVLSPDGAYIDLGAWITLANANSVGFPESRTQIVAGRLNKVRNAVEPIVLAPPIVATCWPQGNTAEGTMQVIGARLQPSPAMSMAAPADQMLEEVVVAGAGRSMLLAKKVEQEQLGDLKLYRIPDTTTVASMQMKQVRLMDRSRIPVTSVYSYSVSPESFYFDESKSQTETGQATQLLRTKNTKANHLGLPLPSGSIAIFGEAQQASLLIQETSLRDLAEDEEVEVPMGDSSAVHVTTTVSHRNIGPASLAPLIPGLLDVRRARLAVAVSVDIANALGHAIPFELKVTQDYEGRVVGADHKYEKKNGQPLFRLEVPANSNVTVKFQMDAEEEGALRR